MSKRGFTLIEMMASVAVAAIISGCIMLVLKATLESWRYGQERLAVQKAASDIMDILTEGGYDDDGIKDATEIKKASPTSFSFVSLWRDDSQRPDKIKNPEQRFTLEKHYKPGSSLPMGQIKERGSHDWQSAQIKFYYGEGSDPANPDDKVVFVKEIPPLADIRIVYKPDSEADSKVIRTFFWDRRSKRIYYTFNGVTEDIIKHDKKVEVDYHKFIYFDGLNQPVEPAEPDAALELKELNRVTAVKIYIRVRKGSEYKEQTSFINIRSTLGGGIAVTEGSRMPIANSRDIKAFYIGNFQGVKGPSVVEFEVTPRRGTAWRVRLDVAPAGQEELSLTNYSIEYPPGNPVFFDRPYQRFSANDSLNLLTIDRSGRYDYDDDEDIRDVVMVEGDGVFLTVNKLDMDGANLFIKP